MELGEEAALRSRAYRKRGLLGVGVEGQLSRHQRLVHKGKEEGREEKKSQIPQCLKLTTVKVSVTSSSSSPSLNKLGFSEN